MQTVSAPYYPHHGHHPPDYDPHLHTLKRHFLSLLPPPQVIEICLAFEPHAPIHVKSSIWPLDLNGAIAALQAHAHPPPVAANVQGEKASHSSENPLTNTTVQQAPAPASVAPDSQPSTSTPGSNAPTQATPSVPPAGYPPPPQLYPHQTYGYPHPPAYPHAPYYPVPGPSHHSYSPYQHAGSPFPNGHLSHPQDPPQSTEDLPSYEEMIVEALMDSVDPEGCAPKDLFSTMASRYPLQTNFRPSASQALQKAFKRGRLEKSSGGKYRLNASWEGGSSSRRTTRRPQTHNQTTAVLQHSQSSSSHSPFTHAPLIRSSQPHPHYPYGYPPPPPSYPPAPTEEDIGEGSDAWEAAQNILKAINFRGMVQLPTEDEKTPLVSKGDSTPPPLDGAANSLMSDSQMPTSSTATDIARAELQAQLALLAAQLADIAEENIGPGGTVGVS